MAYFHIPDPGKAAKDAVNHVIKPARDAAVDVIHDAQKKATDAVWKVRHEGWEKLSTLKNEGEKELHDIQRGCREGPAGDRARIGGSRPCRRRPRR